MNASTTKSNITVLSDLLWHSAARYAELPALLVKREAAFEEITHASLAENALALASALSARLAPRATVLLVGDSGYDFVSAYLALVMGANVPVLADSSLSAATLARLAAAHHATAVLYADEAAEAVSALSLPTAIPFSALRALTEEGRVVAEDEGLSLPEIDPHAPATVFAAENGEDLVLTHGDAAAILNEAAQIHGITERDRFYVTLPLTHTAALVLCVLLPLSCGASVALGAGMRSLLADMRLARPTHMVSVSFLAEAIWQKSLQTVSEKRQNTAKLPASLRAFKEKLLPSARHLFGGKLREMLIVGTPLSDEAKAGLRKIGITATQADGILTVSAETDKETPPADAETRLCQSPLVSEAAVIDIPDGAGNLESLAVLVPAASDTDSALTEQQMEEWVRTVNEALPEHAQIALFTLRTAPLPRDPDGNVCRDRLIRELTDTSL